MHTAHFPARMITFVGKYIVVLHWVNVYSWKLCEERINPQNLFCRAFPRLIAYAERLWSYPPQFFPSHNQTVAFLPRMRSVFYYYDCCYHYMWNQWCCHYVRFAIWFVHHELPCFLVMIRIFSLLYDCFIYNLYILICGLCHSVGVVIIEPSYLRCGWMTSLSMSRSIWMMTACVHFFQNLRVQTNLIDLELLVLNLELC